MRRAVGVLFISREGKRNSLEVAQKNTKPLHIALTAKPAIPREFEGQLRTPPGYCLYTVVVSCSASATSVDSTGI
jgi:hypothetical protein